MAENDALLDSADLALIEELHKQNPGHRSANLIRDAYYHATVRVQDLGIAVPVELRGLRQALSWCKSAIKAPLNKINFLGWYKTNGVDAFGLQKVFEENYLETEAFAIHLDLMLYGVAFALVSSGDPDLGEPEVIVSGESPKNVEVKYNTRTRKVDAGIIITEENDDYTDLIFVDAYRTVRVRNQGEKYHELTGGFYHDLGRCPLVMFVNNNETNRVSGHSEITEAMMSCVQTAMRTQLEMEIAREFYAIPQKWIAGATQAMFEAEDGEMRSKLSVMMDQLLVLMDVEVGADEQGNPIYKSPSIGQFTANDPSTFITILNHCAKEFAAMTNIPQEYLGLTTINPASGDSWRANENLLIDKSKGIIRMIRRPWEEVARLIVLTRDGELPEDFRPLPHFADLSTPARAATADELIKLTGSGLIRKDSEIVGNRLDLSPEEREIWKTENEVANAESLIRALANAASLNATESPAEAVAV